MNSGEYKKLYGPESVLSTRRRYAIEICGKDKSDNKIAKAADRFHRPSYYQTCKEK